MKRGVTIPKSDVAFDAHQFPRALTYTSIYLADPTGGGGRGGKENGRKIKSILRKAERERKKGKKNFVASKSEWAGDLSAFSRPPPPSHGQTNGPKRQNDRRGGRDGQEKKKKTREWCEREKSENQISISYFFSNHKT
ncbi:hypothetical protein CEXT_331851 [Caerostris extrusa]|uniref:Uncharacterized protein n=1 Tax=Caerostris extrusa TaxID=172846 RepID=A0AAV4M1Z3_CAEEX|nr:hypothetical protein CEXT_331851 [Caerostris extrusa]